MAILKSVIPVNNGNTGWTSSDVLDALETAFANLGLHGGSSTSGVPVALVAPNGTVSTRDTGWWGCGGGQWYYSWRDVYYDVIAQGTTAYRWLRKNYFATWSYAWNNTDTNYPSMMRIDRHGYETGDAVHWAPGGTNEAYNIGGLTLDTIYYVIKVNNNYFRLAANAQDASDGTFIELVYGGYSSAQYAAKSSTLYGFRDVDSADYDNRTVEVSKQDKLNISLNATGTGNFRLCYDTDDYDASKHVTSALPGNNSTPTGTGTDSGTVVWDTFGYLQTYDDVTPYPSQHQTESFTAGSRKYIYASETNPDMKGEIVVKPHVTNRGDDGTGNPFWDYEVPQSGSRSALKIRVFRWQDVSSSSYYGHLAGMQIRNIGSGWTQNEVFTIPGDQIGASSPAGDVVFGVRTPDPGGSTGTPAINVKNIGAGSNFYYRSGNYGVVKIVNDANKTYGTSYYSIGVCTDNNNTLVFNSGSGFAWLNTANPYFNGQIGLDRSNSYNTPLTTSGATYYTFNTMSYCTSSTPTAYPLEIRTYRAQAPQDTNFAIIQFCQTINGVVQPYGAFTIYKGATFGSNVWDYNHLYNGSVMFYETATRAIRLSHQTIGPRYAYSGTQGPAQEPVMNDSKAREAFYGYVRDTYAETSIYTDYLCNIETDANSSSSLYLYYRNSTYDRYSGNSVDPAADYYKPIKGLPISERMVPCPYYLPDDFVMLQVSTTPGLTQFRTGDTVTIGGTETYEIIRASYQTQQNGLDGVDNNSTIGMLFLGRIS